MPKFSISQTTPKRIILSVGGSLIVPNEINTTFLKNLKGFVDSYVAEGWQFILVTGGGAPARWYIEGGNAVLDGTLPNDDKDWLGIHATRMNAHLVRTIFRDIAQPAIVKNPEEDIIDENYKVIVASGWKPGWSTDFVATKLAERFQAPLVINISNIDQVFTADPKTDASAVAVETMTWAEFREMVGETWTPGMNTPFDPIAAKLSDQNNISVIVLGSSMENLGKCMQGEEFLGTVLSK